MNAAPGPTLAGLGFAVPRSHRQEDLIAALAEAWGLAPRERDRWLRIVQGSGIERRHAVGSIERALGLSTAERMRLFEGMAPILAAEAGAAALARAGLAGDAVTDLVIVTCTGFTAPGVGHAIIGPLGLSPNVRHSQIGFMGCFGGIIGLRTACGLASADPQAVVLVVCVELCSLHLRRRPDAQQLVAAGIFADGAAAAVVVGAERPCQPLGRLSLGRTRVLHESREEMSWRIEDDGFAMTLTREVPPALERAIGGFIAEDPPRGIAVHPGGAAILDAIERSVADLGLDPRSLPASRAILRDFGNMSSGSVLFVLDRYLGSGGERPVDCIAFGPGLTIDAVRLR